jgi:hypothetical protein
MHYPQCLVSTIFDVFCNRQADGATLNDIEKIKKLNILWPSESLMGSCIALST